MVAAHQEVLPIIHHVAGLRVDEGIGASSEMIAPFEQDDLVAARTQRNACRQAAESPSDYHYARRHVLPLEFAPQPDVERYLQAPGLWHGYAVPVDVVLDRRNEFEELAIDRPHDLGGEHRRAILLR